VKINYVEGSHSDSGQESFVIAMLEGKRNGHYVEIGSAQATLNNNTYLLETEYGWSGVGIELSPEYVDDYRAGRSNPCVLADAITFDYKKYFQENNFPMQIDYLQLDIDPPQFTLAALKALPLETYRFSTITYEHDYYNKPEHYLIKMEAQDILRSYGYSLVADNVLSPWNNPFEDWWIDPAAVSITLTK
jgi:hypothetical protein